MPSKPATQDEDEKRRADCRAKAAYCEWVAQMSPDDTLRAFYATLSVEWDKEACEGQTAAGADPH